MPPQFQRICSLRHFTPQFTRSLPLLGQRVTVESNHPRLPELLTATFGQSAQPMDAPAGRGVRISLWADDSLRFAGNLPAPAYFTQGTLFALTLGESAFGTLNLREGTASAWVSPALLHAEPDFVRLNLCETLALSAAAFAGEFFHLHAGAVQRNGVMLTLHAPSGVGKSTLTYACARAGYKILAEDVVHVRWQTGAPLPEFWGIPWQLHPLPDVTQFFPDVMQHARRVQFNREEKLQIALPQAFPGAALERAQPGALLLLARSRDGVTHLEPISLDAALADVQVFWQWQIGWQPRFEAATAHLAPLGAFRLQMGAHPASAVAALNELTDQLAPELPR